MERAGVEEVAGAVVVARVSDEGAVVFAGRVVEVGHDGADDAVDAEAEGVEQRGEAAGSREASAASAALKPGAEERGRVAAG